MKLKIGEIGEMSGKLKMIREIKKKLGNFAKFFGKLKFLTLRSSIFVHHTYAVLEYY